MAKSQVTLEFKVRDDSTPALKKIQAQLALVETRTKAIQNSSNYSSPQWERLQKQMQGVLPRAERFGKAMEQNQFTMKRFGELSKTAGAALVGVGGAITAGITAPMIGFGVEAIKTAADYEAAMNDLQARTGASTHDLKMMGNEARYLGRSTTFGASQAVEAMASLGKAGFETNEILSGTAGVLNLAAAESMAMDDAANLVANTIQQFGLKAGDANRVVDVLGKSAGMSSISITDLQNTLRYSAKPASDFQISIESLGAAIATMGTKGGIKSEMAGTSLRSFFTTITGEADKIDILMKAGLKGTDIFTDSSMKKMQPLEKVFGNLKKLNLSPIQMTKIFGREAAGNIKTLIDNTDHLTANIKELGNANGFVAEVAAAKTKGLQGEWARLKNAVEDTYLTLTEGDGGPLETLTKLVGKVRDAVNWFKDLNPAVQNFILITGGIMAVLGPVLGGFGLFLLMLPGMIAGWGVLTTEIGLFTAGVWGLEASLAPILGGLALFAAAAFIIYKNWDNLKPLFEWMGEKISYLWEKMKLLINGISSIANMGLNSVGIKSIPMLDAAPSGVPMVSGTAFEPSKNVANGSFSDQKNELFVNFGGFIPQGTTVKESPGNTSNMQLNMGRAMN